MHAQELTGTAACDHAISLLKGAVERAATLDGVVAGKVEAQVHRAIDLLRSTSADAELRFRFEQVSCLLFEMSHLLRQGQVNAYSSKMLRLKRAAELI